MTPSPGPWKHPTKPRASSSRARVFLIALAVAFLALATTHATVKAVANLAEFNANQEDRR